MQEKLPHVFANKVTNASNNKKFYYSKLENKDLENNNIVNPKKNNENKIINKYNLKETVKKNEIRNKLINIFKSPNNVYKVKVNIKMDGKIITKYLIGRTNTNLITLDDELIEIDKIEYIEETK